MSMGEQIAGLRILFFGLPSGASALALQGLLREGWNVVAVVVPAELVPHLLPDHSPPVTNLSPPVTASIPLGDIPEPADTLAVGWTSGVPVLAVSDLLHSQTQTVLTGLDVDVACVACYPHRIPQAILRRPRLGFINLHPSLLPAYRGPSPLFWQLRDGAPAGVTIHYMDENLDTGPIAAQQVVLLPDGISGPEATRLLTGAGLELLQGVLRELAEGTIRRWPQPPGGSYQRQPQTGDFSLSTEWPARRAFNFMRGTADWGRAYSVTVAGETLSLSMADSYNDLELGRPSVRHGRNILIRFNPGILYARMVG